MKRVLHWAARIIFLLALMCGFSEGSARSQTQGTASYEELRTRAFQLYTDGKTVQALPLLEELAAANPKDIAVHERLGLALLGSAATLNDPEQRRQRRIRARKVLLEAKDLGDRSQLLLIVLEGLPEDGSEAAFSSHNEADEAMREGEAAFVHGDYENALEAYQNALLFDPNLYDAALFSGDVCYKQEHFDQAGKWYAKAIAMNPDRETAYRYWGDALVKNGERDTAREKYIEAIVAEPYLRRSWAGLLNWAKANKLTLTHPLIESPNQLSSKEGNLNIVINADTLDKKDGTNAWLLYEISRAAWKTKLFAERYPNEKAYRHTLAEETDALTLVANRVKEELKASEIKQLDPQLSALLRLQEDGLLEAYILFARADQGIAQDYQTYRSEHRDKLRQYLREWVIPSTKN